MQKLKIAEKTEKKERNCAEGTIRVLILSDRLLREAQSMAEYLDRLEHFEVMGIALNKQQTLELAEDGAFDFLIIAGYLRVFDSYEVIAELESMKKSFQTVHWAMLDSLIFEFCKQYQIFLTFDRTLPMEAFADFLWECKYDKNRLVEGQGPNEGIAEVSGPSDQKLYRTLHCQSLY